SPTTPSRSTPTLRRSRPTSSIAPTPTSTRSAAGGWASCRSPGLPPPSPTPSTMPPASACATCRSPRTNCCDTLVNEGTVIMPIGGPILVTGAAGRIGGVGGAVVEALRRRGLPVRALVRRDDERAEALRVTGVEVVVADLTRAADVLRALAGCRCMYFGMSVSAPYLEATVATAVAARERGHLEVFVNMSQMTVSRMSLTETTDSPQHRQHWLAEHALN